MRYRIGVIFGVLFTLGISFKMTGVQEPTPRVQEPKREANSISVDREIDKARDKISPGFQKYDSVLAERETIIVGLKDVTTRQASTIKTLEKSNRRLEALAHMLNADSVRKFNLQYIDPEDVKTDSLKKKIETEIEVPKPRKKGFFKRIFGRKQ